MAVGLTHPGSATGPSIVPRGLERPAGHDGQLRILKYTAAIVRAVEAGGGAFALVDAPAQGMYLVERVTFHNTVADAGFAMYAGAFSGDATNLLDAAPVAVQSGVLAETPPILVPDRQPLVLGWFGLGAGAICTARVQLLIVTL